VKLHKTKWRPIENVEANIVACRLCRIVCFYLGSSVNTINSITTSLRHFTYIKIYFNMPVTIYTIQCFITAPNTVINPMWRYIACCCSIRHRLILQTLTSDRWAGQNYITVVIRPLSLSRPIFHLAMNILCMEMEITSRLMTWAYDYLRLPLSISRTCGAIEGSSSMCDICWELK
jgi:hypothetical protein